MRAEMMGCDYGFVLLFVIVLTPFTNGIGVVLDCPESFSNEINNITCTINRTAIESAGCLSKQSSVSFDLTRDSVSNTECYVAYGIPDICNGELHSDKPCWCDKSEGDIFIYKWSFAANSSKHRGARVECKLCVDPKNVLSVTTTGSCNKFKFEDDEITSETNGGSLVITRLTPAVIVITLFFTVILKSTWTSPV